MTPRIDELRVADEPDAWRSAGFTVDDDGVASVGTVRIRLVGTADERGIVGWVLRDLAGSIDGAIDGLPTEVTDRAPTTPAQHANGVTAIDHVVVATSDCDRTIEALARVGIEARRSREMSDGGAMRQTFFRLGEVILELVGPGEAAGDDPARFWGLAYTVDDLGRTAEALGGNLGPAKDAVQEGRMIATLRHEPLGISVATAFMSPEPRR